jgi:hypothetical protein
MAGVVHFRLGVPLPGLQAGPRPDEEIRFANDDLGLALFRLPGADGAFTDDMVVVVTAQREVPEDVLTKLTAFIEETRNEPPAPQLSEDVVMFTGADAIWFIAPPENVHRLFGDIHEELAAPAARLVGILRWRFNRPYPANPMAGAELDWSLDGATWHRAPGGAFHAPLVGSTGPVLDPPAFEEIHEWWASQNPVVPLSRQILVDANTQLGENNRAAIALAVAAVEVGVKEFCATKGNAESEAWLLREMASPPLRRLLRDYTVFFTSRRTTDGRSFPKPLLVTLDRAIEARNRIVHRGDLPPMDEETAAILVAANDVLYLLDWFAGHDWALAHVSREVASAYTGGSDE